MANISSIGFLGTGHMGAALLKGVLQANLLKPQNIHIFDANPLVMEELSEVYGVKSVSSISELLHYSSVVILGVKPQTFPQIASEFYAVKKPRILISIMAGLSSEKITSLVGKQYTVVRTMPNLPLSVLSGVTGIEKDNLDEEVLELTETIFSGSGTTVRVSGNDLNAVTGLSGSGPMYVFEFVEGLIQAGIDSGLTQEVSRTLTLKTVEGALKLLESSSETPSEMSAKVRSKGGTTEKGYEQLNQHQFKNIISKAVGAATRRSAELGD